MITDAEYLELEKKCPWYAEPYEGQEEDKAKMREYNKALIAKFPWLEPTNRWSGKKIVACKNGEQGYWPGEPEKLPDYDYEHTELDNMPTGWRLAFGIKMCEEIQEELEKFNFVDEYRITDIKEKYGTLRWYDNGSPIGNLSEDYEVVIREKHSYAGFSEEYSTFRYIGQTPDGKFEFHRYDIIDKCHIHDIINRYERLSARTCIDCGEVAQWSTVGWISPYCTKCKESIEADDRFNDTFEPLGV